MTNDTTAGTRRAHRERLARDIEPLAPAARPEPGPIAILPGERAGSFAQVVEAAGGTVAPLGPETRGIIYLSASRVDGLVEVLEAHPNIGWVQLPFAGIENFAPRVREFAQRGVLFTSAKGSYAEPVAEHALALTLSSLRFLQQRARATSWGPKIGTSLYGANVVIVGAGGIALEYLELVRPFRVHTTIVRRNAADTVASADRTIGSDELASVLPEADVVLLAAAATGETRGLIGAAELAAMKPTAVLVNIARGALIDTDALVTALDAGEIAGAAIDVTDPEPLPAGHALYSHPLALVTPHSADTHEMTKPLLQVRIAANVEAFLGTGRFVGVADPHAGY